VQVVVGLESCVESVVLNANGLKIIQKAGFPYKECSDKKIFLDMFY
jgi:hypothetical protein